MSEKKIKNFNLNIVLWQLLQWDLIAKEEGLGCIIFNEEGEQSVESESGNKHLIVKDFDLMDSPFKFYIR